MRTKDTEFKPGMKVAYVVKLRGVVQRVISIAIVKSVGNRDIKLVDSESRFRISGQSWSGLYEDRWIVPLTLSNMHILDATPEPEHTTLMANKKTTSRTLEALQLFGWENSQGNSWTHPSGTTIKVQEDGSFTMEYIYKGGPMTYLETVDARTKCIRDLYLRCL